MKKILVVEDEANARDLYKEELCEAGFDVVCVPDGATALQCVENEKFDPSLELAFKISRFFKVRIEDVFLFDLKEM